MIVITYEVKNTVDYDTIEFFLKFSPIFYGILPDTVYTYEQIT